MRFRNAVGNARRRHNRNRRRCRFCRPASPARNSPTAPCCGRTRRAPTSAASAPASPRRRCRARRGPASRTPSALMRGSASRITVTSLPSGVTTRGREFRGELRQRRQRRDGRNGRATPARRRCQAMRRTRCRDRCGASDRRNVTGETRSDQTGIDQDVQPRGLDQPARMTDERQPHLVALDARRRRIGMALGTQSGHCEAPSLAELPAQHLGERFRRRCRRVEEALAVEMIGDGPA